MQAEDWDQEEYFDNQFIIPKENWDETKHMNNKLISEKWEEHKQHCIKYKKERKKKQLEKISKWCNKFPVYVLVEDSENWEDWLHFDQTKSFDNFMLPNYLLIDVLLNIPDLPSLKACMLSCCDFLSVIDMDLFWRKYYNKYFLSPMQKQENKDAKEIFKEKYIKGNIKTNIQIERGVFRWKNIDYLNYIFNNYEKTKQFNTLKKIINDYVYKKIGFHVIDKFFFSCVKKCSKYGGAGVNLIIKLNEFDEHGYIE